MSLQLSTCDLIRTCKWQWSMNLYTSKIFCRSLSGIHFVHIQPTISYVRKMRSCTRPAVQTTTKRDKRSHWCTMERTTTQVQSRCSSYLTCSRLEVWWGIGVDDIVIELVREYPDKANSTETQPEQCKHAQVPSSIYKCPPLVPSCYPSLLIVIHTIFSLVPKKPHWLLMRSYFVSLHLMCQC